MFREVKKITDILVCSFRMTVKAQYQYKVNFWLRFVVMFITYFSEFLSTWFLITKFNSVGEWKREDIMLTYGLATLAYALSRFFFAGFNGVSRQLKDGSFYLKMLRPYDEKFILFIQGMPLDRLGQVVLGTGILVYACMKHNFSISLGGVLFYVLIGTLIYGALFVISAAIAFWVVDSRELTGIMTHGTLRAVVYPLSIYKKIIRELLTFIIPVAFVSYYPAMILLGKETSAGIRYLVPAVGIAVYLFSLILWKTGIKKYEGSGG